MVMAARSSMAPRKSTARQPLIRPGPPRAQSATPTLVGRTSPQIDATTTSTIPLKSPARATNGNLKRKERDFDKDSPEEETNINVVVRCRGRNDREVKENSGVVVSTEGVKGKKVDLSMGPNAVGNKTYNFDKVFSPAANQEMVFNEVVSPILDEVLTGFNCTIFAYGQTGTGKTYTMSGDITDSQPLPDGAGIIPRVLYGLFDRLGGDEGENSVKVSFIELYNEELRDLLSIDDGTKLKIYDDNSKKGSTTTMVQGMEETHIKSASGGLELLKHGSHKRQVAATKCNDLSSRSHSVFTVTVYMKRTSETGEDFVSAGKLNLVDLAGSENIQRSGAENKRAAEAGLINKSLLTLGRVINALVERSSHIPYRESKLTRLLQDSLGGRTKTCIVATLSPARSNLEETISTLDYAFRAKNIKNKPQANQTMSKKTLLREFTTEIEKLKSELMATRQRNGVYLTQEAFEEIQGESESRRILSEEQRDKIEILENSLRNKVQELYTLTNNFNGLKKDSEATRMTLDGTQSLLEKTEVVLAHTKKSLAEESYVRKAHQRTEDALRETNGELVHAMETTTGDIRGLHAKIRRRSDLHAINRETLAAKRNKVVKSTSALDQRMEDLRERQEGLLQSLSNRMQSFVKDEIFELERSQEFLGTKVSAFKQSELEINAQTDKARDEMNHVLQGIKTLREDVRDKVGAGMQDLSSAAQRISAGISSELDGFHTQLHSSYSTLGREFKAIFEDMSCQLSEQKAEAERLRAELLLANETLAASNAAASQALHGAFVKEKEIAAAERVHLLAQISNLVNQASSASEARTDRHLQNLVDATCQAASAHTMAEAQYATGMDTWSSFSQDTLQSLVSSRDNIKSKIKSDWSSANATSEAIKRTTEAVHSQTIEVVNAQMAAMDEQLISLDGIISRVGEQNQTHHAAHSASLVKLVSDVEESYSSIGAHMQTSLSRTQLLSADMTQQVCNLSEANHDLSKESALRTSLSELRQDLASVEMTEYVPSGSTPAKAVYTYPTTLPCTDTREVLLDRMHRGTKSPRLERKVYIDRPACNTAVVVDAMDLDAKAAAPDSIESVPPRRALSRSDSLRELDPNTSVFAAQTSTASSSATAADSPTGPGAATATTTTTTTTTSPLSNTTTVAAPGPVDANPVKSASRLPSALPRSNSAPASDASGFNASGGAQRKQPASRLQGPAPVTTTMTSVTSSTTAAAGSVVVVTAAMEKENVAPVVSSSGAPGAAAAVVASGDGKVADLKMLGVTGPAVGISGGGRRSARLTRGRGSE